MADETPETTPARRHFRHHEAEGQEPEARKEPEVKQEPESRKESEPERKQEPESRKEPEARKEPEPERKLVPEQPSAKSRAVESTDLPNAKQTGNYVAPSLVPGGEVFAVEVHGEFLSNTVITVTQEGDGATVPSTSTYESSSLMLCTITVPETNAMPSSSSNLIVHVVGSASTPANWDYIIGVASEEAFGQFYGIAIYGSVII